MGLLQLVVVLIIVGVLLGLVNKYGPPWISAPFISLINAVVGIAVVLWDCGRAVAAVAARGVGGNRESGTAVSAARVAQASAAG